MSCGCQDKENDAAIIAEVERRKLLSNQDYYFENVLAEGSLPFILSMHNEHEIENICRREENVWQIKLKIYKSIV